VHLPLRIQEGQVKPIRPTTATILMVVASVSFAVMALFAKAVSSRIPATEIAFFRFGVGLVAVAVAATRTRLRPRNWRGLILRGALGSGTVLCGFIAIQHLPVGIASVLSYTAPAFAAGWAWFLLGERVSRRAIVALLITCAGLGCVIFAAHQGQGASRWHVVAVLAAVLMGGAMATIRELRKTDGPWEVFAAFGLAGVLVSGVPMAHDYVAPTVREWGLLLAVGLLALLSQLCMTVALGTLRATVAATLCQLTPVAALVLGGVVYGESPAALAITGSLIIVGGVIWGSVAPADDEEAEVELPLHGATASAGEG
jgi:drug/metabolite transporter (DMT)-like permease